MVAAAISTVIFILLAAVKCIVNQPSVSTVTLPYLFTRFCVRVKHLILIRISQQSLQILCRILLSFLIYSINSDLSRFPAPWRIFGLSRLFTSKNLHIDLIKIFYFLHHLLKWEVFTYLHFNKRIYFNLYRFKKIVHEKGFFSFVICSTSAFKHDSNLFEECHGYFFRILPDISKLPACFQFTI